jgi:hypothetical protein
MLPAWQNHPARFPPPWRADPMPDGCVIRDANGQALAYLYCRENDAEARQAKALTKDEARRIAVNIARLPELLHREKCYLINCKRADTFSAGAFRRLSLDGGMSALTPAPTTRVHDPSGVATHGDALASAGQSAFRSERVVMALLVSRLAADLRFAVTVPPHDRMTRGLTNV